MKIHRAIIATQWRDGFDKIGGSLHLNSDDAMNFAENLSFSSEQFIINIDEYNVNYKNIINSKNGIWIDQESFNEICNYS